jgi:two-component system, cell cycle sensor histidine kinase and response regulator CckA
VHASHYLSGMLILVGAAVMAFAIARFRLVLRLIEADMHEEQSKLRRIARINLGLMAFFLFGYLVVLGCLVAHLNVMGEFLMAAIFLAGAAFVLHGVVMQRRMLESWQRRFQQTRSLNEQLKAEQDELSRAHEHLVRILDERRQAETERDRLQAELYQAQKLKALGTLAGGIAHDFNNMLGGIMGFAELIKRKHAAGNPGLERYASTIIETSHRAAELTAELLTFARKGGTEQGAVDMHEVVADVVKLLERTIDRRITITANLRADPATLNGDRSRLQNALLNLGLNGRDAMPQGGTLTYATSTVRLSRDAAVAPEGLEPGAYLAVSVTDTGTGMSEETRRHLFEPFFTTKPQGRGTGLGLASVYGTARAHLGTVAVESTPGKGSTFTLYIRSDAPALPEGAAQAALPARPVHGTGRILLVDDEEVVRTMATEMLREFGYEVTACADGGEAVETFRRQPTAFDLVVLDMVMPRVSGSDCFTQLQALRADVRVLVATGYADERETQAMVANGTRGVLRKPYTAASLSAAVAQALG